MDLANFLLSKSSKVLNEVIEKTWKLQTASEYLHLEKSRMDILRELWFKLWLKCAMEVLRNNNLHPFVYAAAIRDLLVNGRGKFRNLMIQCRSSKLRKSIHVSH